MSDIAIAAPRLTASNESAPLPANPSSTRAPSSRPPSMLKRATFARSEVGRVSWPGGVSNFLERSLPPMMRNGIPPKAVDRPSVKIILL